MSAQLFPSVIYESPTASQLAKRQFSDEQTDARQTVEDLLAKYTKNIPSVQGKPEPLDNGQTVHITGTTGSLGAYLLDCLCAMNTVRKVVALNRD